jgi:hypothetical protein
VSGAAKELKPRSKLLGFHTRSGHMSNKEAMVKEEKGDLLHSHGKRQSKHLDHLQPSSGYRQGLQI